MNGKNTYELVTGRALQTPSQHPLSWGRSTERTPSCVIPDPCL